MSLVWPEGLKKGSDASASFGQDKMQAMQQTIVKEVNLRSEGSSGVDTDTEEHIFSAGFSEDSKEKHTGREKKVEGINRGKGSHPEVFKRKGLFFAAEVLLNSPAGEIKSHSGDELIL